MSAAVVLCLDRNKLVEQESGPPMTHFYEIEAVECVKAWRENAGWTGKICAVQYEGREISDKTVCLLEDMGVRLTTLRFPPVKRPFMEVVYALAFAERGELADEDRILYSDLDVIMWKPVPSCFTDSGKTVLYHYRADAGNVERDSPEFLYRMKRCIELGIFCHNTYFQAFDRGGTFIQTILDLADSSEYLDFFENNVYYRPTDDDYFFEEGLYDYVCSTYGKAFDITDIECPSVFFDHVHAHRRILKHDKTSL